MAKYKEVPVDYDPFAKKEPSYKEVPVDYDPFAEKPADNTGNFMRGLENTLPSLYGTAGAAQTLAGLTANKLGFEDTGKSLVEKGLEKIKYGEEHTKSKETDEFTNAWHKGIGSVLTEWLPYQIGSGVGNLAETAAFMGIGAGVGAVTGAGVGAAPGALAGAVEGSLIKAGVKAEAEKILKDQGEAAAKKYVQAQTKVALKEMGTGAGMAAQAGLHGAGEVTQQAYQAEEQRAQDAGRSVDLNNIDLGRVIPAAMVHGVADFVNEKIGIGALKIGEKAEKHLVTEILKRIAVTGGKEMGGEEIQTIAERFGANMSLADADALKDYINTAAASFGMSVLPGAIGGARSHLANSIISDAKLHKEVIDRLKSGPETQKMADEINPPLNPETNELLQPSKDVEDETPLVEASATTKRATEELNTETSKNLNPIQEVTQQAEEKQLTPVQQDAAKYIAEIEDGTKQPNASTLGAIIGKLGIPRPEKGPDFRKRAVQAIKDHLAGVNNAEQPNGQPSGISTAVVQPTDQGQPAAGTAGPNANGVVSPGQNVGVPNVGEATKPPSIEAPYTPITITDTDVLAPYSSRVSTLPTQEQEQKTEPIVDEEPYNEEEEQKAKDDAYIQALGKSPAKHNRITPEQIEEYEETRKTLKEKEEIDLPAWEDLSAADKDIYFSHIKNNTIEENQNAGMALNDFREKISELGLDKKKKEQRAVASYEEDKTIQSKLIGLDFPSWGELSEEAKNAYLNETRKNDAGHLRDKGFDAVADQLEQEGTHVRGVTKEKANELRLKYREEQRRKEAGKEATTERESQEEATGKGIALSNDIVTELKNGDINAAISLLISDAKGLSALQIAKGEKTYGNAFANYAERWSKASKFIFQFVARSLSKIKLNSSVVMDEKNPVIQRLIREGKLAEYDPKTDTFYFTKQGLDESTLLHEAVHAATVTLINRYLTDPSKLTQEQHEAMDHLNKIYDFAKKRIGGRYKNAFENLYEFIGYALTDNKFQTDLANIQARSLAKYTLNGESLWKQLTKMFQKVYGLFTAKGQSLQAQPDVFDALVKSWNPVDKNGLYKSVEEDEGEITTEVGEQTKGQETEVKESRKKYKQGKQFLGYQKGFEGNLMLEISEVFSNILTPPEKGLDVAPLAATKQAPELREVDLDSKDDGYGLREEDKPKTLGYFTKLLSTPPGWRHIATLFQNSRYPIKNWEDVKELAEQIYHEGKDKINNIYTQITLAAATAKNLYTKHVAEQAELLNQRIGEYAKDAGLTTEEALAKLHKILEALHEPERRAVKYLMIVPLSNDKLLIHNGKKISPADRRKAIFDLLDKHHLTENQQRQLRAEMEKIAHNPKYQDPLGDSPYRATMENGAGVALSTDIKNQFYNVTGLSEGSVKTITDQYKNNPHKEIIDKIIESIKELHKSTTALDKMANYWSQPVTNRVGFYGYENYVPLKGITDHTEIDEMLHFDSPRTGKEMQDVAYSFDGRVSVSDNPVLQTMSDATRSAMRAGRRDLTLAIRNAIDQGLLAGSTKLTIPFEDRGNKELLKKIPKENTVFHYNEDGSIQVLQIYDKNLREAIRRTYQQTKPVVELANKITSALGSLHTRYNWSFAPMNFVRDALTNAFAIGADMGPAEAAKFIKAVTGQVMKGGMYKAMQVAVLYQNGDATSQNALNQMASKDPYVKDMIDFIEHGGMVSYLQGLALKSNFQALHKEIGRSGILKTKDQLDKFVDIWTDMFELASRSAAFGIAKRNQMARGKTEQTAIIKATAYAKNLANFEQVGELGKVMGAFYMFFRPSATGAVRAIEAVAPAFRRLETVIDELPPDIRPDENGVSKNPKALEAFIKNYSEKQAHARVMTIGLMALGAIAYSMAAMMSDDDELGRNSVATDNMQQWTRFLRFHIPRGITRSMGISEPVIVQIPWGFGLGAFAASGAQLASVAAGTQSMKDALANIFLQISLDSFVPIPVSKMPPTEMPIQFMLDSIAPSVARPILEFALNKNGLGQDIYNDQNRRFGDAYTAGDHIPQLYKDAARYFANTSMGGIDISPNTLYFLSNSYADGVGRVFEMGYGLMDLTQGKKAGGFNPKTDLPLFSSFFGAKSNVDSREFASVEKQMLEMERKIKMFDTDPLMGAKYELKNPFDKGLVESFNKQVNGELKKLRTEAKQVRLQQGISESDRAAQIKLINLQENLIKHNIVQEYKAYGIKP